MTGLRKRRRALESLVVSGVNGVEMLAASQHTPCRQQGSGKARMGLARRAMEDDADAVLLQMAGSIEEMRGKLPVSHSAEAVLYVLSMVEVDLHFGWIQGMS